MDSVSTKVAIVGAGPGGLSAGLWCADLGLDHVVLESGPEAGGQLLWTFNEIDNYLGMSARNGEEVRDRFASHAARRGVAFRFGSRCVSFDPNEMSLGLEDGGSVRAEVIIVATGVSRRTPDVAGYDQFLGNGVLFSGKRDKELARGGRAVVVGGGDAAFENALILSETASSVTLVHRRSEFSARPEFIEAVSDDPKISILTDTVVTELNGTGSLRSVTLRNPRTGTERSVSADAIVFRIGVKPNSEVFSEFVKTDEKGYLKIGPDCRTSVPGIYAVGDVANPDAPTIASAAGMGSTAVKSAFFWLERASDIQFPELFTKG